MSVRSEARELLGAAVPWRFGDNWKSWTAHAARVLGWTERRIRAIRNGEARRIDAHEIRQLEDRINHQQQRAAQREEDRHDIRALLRATGEDVSLSQRAPDRPARPGRAPDSDVGPGQGRRNSLDG